MTQKGSNTERQLSNILEDDYGYACLRAPASGGATDRARPDLVAINNNGIYAIELKSNKDGTAHFSRKEILQLNEWADRAGATALVGVKPDLRLKEHDSWYFLITGKLNGTSGGNFSLIKKLQPAAKSIEQQFG